MSNQPSNFVFVIAIPQDDRALYPLTNDEYPKCLIPVATLPILQRQLQVLESLSLEEVYITAPNEIISAISIFLTELDHRIHIHLVPVVDCMGPCDGIRALCTHPTEGPSLSSHFVILSGDVLFDREAVVSLINQHSLKPTSALTVLLANPLVSSRSSSPGDQEDVGDENKDFTLLDAEGRLYLKAPLMEVESGGLLALHKSFLKHAPNGRLRLRSSWADTKCYVLAPWVTHFLLDRSVISSIRLDLIPALSELQFCPPDQLPLSFLDRQLPLSSSFGSSSLPQTPLESSASLASLLDLVRGVGSEERKNPDSEALGSRSGDSLSRVDSMLPRGDGGFSLPSQELDIGGWFTLEACVLGGSTSSFGGRPGKVFPVHSLESLRTLTNRFKFETSQLIPTEEDVQAKDSLIASPCEVGEGLKLKALVLEKDGRLGDGCKINNCIIMKGTSVGPRCTIQNSIIGMNVTIGEGSNLNDCVVENGAQIDPKSKLKGETILNQASGMMF